MGRVLLAQEVKDAEQWSELWWGQVMTALTDLKKKILAEDPVAVSAAAQDLADACQMYMADVAAMTVTSPARLEGIKTAFTFARCIAMLIDIDVVQRYT